MAIAITAVLLALLPVVVHSNTVVNALVSAIFFTRLRFRIPFDFLLLAVNAAFVARCWAARRAGRVAVAQ